MRPIPSYTHLEPVEVFDGQKWRQTMIDSPYSQKSGKTWSGEYGWICVTGWPGRSAPASIRVEHVRKLSTEK